MLPPAVIRVSVTASVQSPPVSPVKESTALLSVTNTKATANLESPDVVTSGAAIVLEFADPNPPSSLKLEVSALRKAYILASL